VFRSAQEAELSYEHGYGHALNPGRVPPPRPDRPRPHDGRRIIFNERIERALEALGDNRSRTSSSKARSEARHAN
jgi:hypothetical protein